MITGVSKMNNVQLYKTKKEPKQDKSLTISVLHSFGKQLKLVMFQCCVDCAVSKNTLHNTYGKQWIHGQR